MRLLFVALAALFCTTVSAQDPARLVTFIDCQGYVPGCDEDFFQTEVGFAKFVRDPSSATVYVLVVREGTGGGGNRYTLLFDGRRGPALGRRDTLQTSTPPGASDDDQRRALLGKLSLGLAGYASKIGLSGRLTVSYDAPEGLVEEESEVADPWNSWVFRINGNGNVNGEASSQSGNVNASFSASRVTEEFKVSIQPRGNFNFNSYTLTASDDSDSTVVSTRSNLGLSAGAVKSLGPHWSAGARLDLDRNTYSNIAGRFELGPAIEYNLYPYSESTQRQLLFYYTASLQAIAYQDTTIFSVKEEVLGQHQIGMGAEFAQPWGSLDLYSSASQYLAPDRFDKYNLRIGGGVNLRVVRGLSLRFNGQYRFVRDQIGLKQGRQSDGEILTNQFEQATGYSYYASVGVSYSFGSIYNQVVNPRLD